VFVTPEKAARLLALCNSTSLARSRHRALDPPQAQLILPGQRVMTRVLSNAMTMKRNPHV
jgi:hypothetical protein